MIPKTQLLTAQDVDSKVSKSVSHSEFTDATSVTLASWIETQNASINILNKGLNRLPQELGEVTLVESAKHSMKQEEATVLVRW